MSDTRPRRAPAAFRLETTDRIEFEDEAFAAPVAVMAPVPGRRRGFPWGKLFVAGAGALLSFAVGLWAVDTVTALFAREGWLGWLGLGLAGLAAVGALGFVLRETLALARLARLRKLQDLAEIARKSGPEARRLTAALDRLYAGRPELARARAELSSHRGEVIDPADRVDLAERTLLAPLDAEARRLISDAARRVSVVTAVSPAALVDIGFVAFSHLGLIRRLAELYGGRPGLIAMARLARAVLTHLAVTGGIALGDGLIQQVLGHGLAAKLSARLGEGVLHGILATRVGLAAMDVSRPLPFSALPRPTVTELAASVARPGGRAEKQLAE
jgi:putative membrane protein